MYRFNFDGYFNGNACGWIFDQDNPNSPVTIGIYVDGELITSGLANSLREDLVLAGLETSSCAFKLPIGTDIYQTLEVRVVADGTLLSGSRKNVSATDPFVNAIVRGGRFDTYVQFQPKNLRTKAAKSRPPRSSRRLSIAFSKVVKVVEGVSYNAHMFWLCSKLKRGAPSFFSRNRVDPLDDLYWYLFECDESSKSLVEFDYGGVSDPVFPRFSKLAHHTVLFDVWLHRNGRQLIDIRLDGLRAQFDFAVHLLNSHVSPPVECDLANRGSFNNALAAEDLVSKLPSMTNYLLKKYEHGYRELYRLDEMEAYLEFLFDCCIHSVSEPEIRLFGAKVLKFFQEPIPVQHGSVSRFALLCYIISDRAARRHEADFSLVSALLVQKWFDEIWLISHPLHATFSCQDLLAQDINSCRRICYVIANWNSQSGLKQCASMSAKAIVDQGITVIKLLPNGTFFDCVEPESKNRKCELVRDIVLLHVNADDAPSALYKISGWVDLDTAFVIGYFLWELEKVPEAHYLGIDLVDEVWVPTEFVADAYDSVASGKVQKIGIGISVPEVTDTNRGKFNFDENVKILLTAFDFHSSLERKNPVAAIKAFQSAFVDREDVRLVLKSTPSHPAHWGDPFDQWGQVKGHVLADERLVLIEDFFPDREMFELIAVCDVIVSPHRAEGFGYLPAYGLLYGKPVVVTGYSGTNSYCDHTCAWIANYDLVKVPAGRFIYPVPDAVWAEVDVESLAMCMQQAVESIEAKNVKSKRSRGKKQIMHVASGRFSYKNLSERYVARFCATGVAVNLLGAVK
jgi:glycosyltransferase involved in cell wall biosynthesis